MAHLGATRKGWQNENLASFILSKFSFIARPTSIADDLGSDFYCTLFQTRRQGSRDYLLPKNSFAMQIKSNRDKFDVSNKVPYLSGLELPFFVGVIDQDRLNLTIYAGEYMPMFFSYKGSPETLLIELCDTVHLEGYFRKSRGGKYVLKFPKVMDINASVCRDEVRVKVDTLSEVCFRMHQNIASRKSNEFIFKAMAYGPPLALKGATMFAGKGSIKVFRQNLLDRLAETFYNLTWLYQNYPSRFDVSEFAVHERLFLQLRGLPPYQPIPEYLTKSYDFLKHLLERQAANRA